MRPTNFFRDEKMALKCLKKERPDLTNPEAELRRLLSNGTWRLGPPPVKRYADADGRYVLVD